MRTLVTGLGGFIGSSLGPLLEARGHEVRGAGREVAVLADAFRGCDAVVHLANIAHEGVRPELLWRVNVEGSARAAELAAANGVRRFVYLSSVKAESPAPSDRYGAAKLAAEREVARVASRTGLEAVILRPPLVYGPRVRANFLRLLQAIDRGWPLPLASIDNRRSLVYVGNLCDAIACCVEAAAPDGRTFFVTDGAPLSTPGLCREIGAALGRPARLFGFPPRLLELVPGLTRLTRSLAVDDSPLRRSLDWKAPHTLQEGLRATVAWYRGSAAPESARYRGSAAPESARQDEGPPRQGPRGKT
jgi:nucleoside-diphosphate-sugar epimerase